MGKVMKKALLWAMALVFVLFVGILMLGLSGVVAGVDLSIVTAVVLIGLFVSFIVVSEWDRKGRKGKS